MVIIHGYAAGGALFYAMLKQLSQFFHIYLIDLIGMGGSGRPPYTPKDTIECEDYFTESIEKWRIEVGLQDPFILTGHSMGGYLSYVYTAKYPHNIKRLLLLSPVGFPKLPEGFDYT